MNKMKMKTCMMTLAGLVLAMAASAQNFVMKGKVKGNVDGCSVMLQKYGLEGVTNLDSVTIKMVSSRSRGWLTSLSSIRWLLI